MINVKKVLFIGAHPDDIELYCSGLIQNFRKNNIQVSFIIGSWGSFGGDVIDRQIEQKKALCLLGIKDFECLCLPDTEIAINGINIKLLEKYISDYEPDVIFTHYPNDTHQDHRNISEMVKSICYRKNKNLIYFDSNSSINFIPNYIEPIDWDRKEKVINIFESQINKPNVLNKIKIKSNYYSLNFENNVEGFLIERFTNS